MSITRSFYGGPVTAFSAAMYGSVANAYAAASAAGGGVVFAGPGVWPCDDLIWTDGKVHLQGAGDATILRATTSTAAVLNIQVGGSGRGRFSDFIADGAGLATNPILQTISVETSVGTRFERVQAMNSASATDFQWVNNGCEDCTYIDCSTPGNEGSPLSIPASMSLNIPNGACRIIGGELFGAVVLAAQLVSMYGTTAGPVAFNNPGANASFSLRADGCYLYDGNAQGYGGGSAVGTGNNLGNITMSGCYVSSQDSGTIVNGNIPAGVNVNLIGNTFAFNPVASLFGLQASGGGGATFLGNTAVIPSGATYADFNAVGTSTTVVTKVS